MQRSINLSNMADYFIHRTEDVFVFAGRGNDVIMEDDKAFFTSNDVYFGQAGNDTIISESGNDVIFGGRGNDTVIAELGQRTLDIRGGRGYDVLILEREFGPHPLNAYEVKYSGFEEVHYI